MAFPPMMSTENPYVGAAARAGADAASGMEMVQRLRTTAAQQQQLAYQQRQKEFAAEMEIRKEGGVPYQPYVVDPTAGSNGLQRRAPNPAQNDKTRVVTTPGGQQFYMPEKAEKPTASPQQTYSDTAALLEKGATPLNFTPVPGSDPQAVSPPGSGGQYYHVPTGDEKAASELANKTKQAEALRQLGTMDVPPELADKLGLKAGAKATFHDIATAYHENLPPEKDAKQPAAHITTATDDAGNITITRTDPDTGKEMWTRVVKGAGVKRKDPDAPGKPSQAEADRNQAAVERLQEKQDKLSAQAQEYRELADQYQSQIGVANGEKYTDPMDKSRMARVANAGSRTALGQGYMRAKTKAEALEKQAASFAGEIQTRQQRTPAAAAPPAARAPQTPAPQPQPAKQAGVDSVRAYAQQKGIPLAQAVREFQDSGYSIAR